MGKFKVFDTIDKFMKLYEADEDPAAAEGGNEMAGEGAAGADATEPPAEGADPMETAGAEEGEFISRAQKAEWAKLMLDALMAPVPPAGRVPANLMEATPDNADEIIKLIQGLVSIERPLSLDDSVPGESMANALKDTSSGSL
jgi:hypothetical protein